MEEDGEGVNLDGAGEGCDDAKVKLIPACDACGHSAEDGKPAKRLTACGRRQQRLNKHDEDADDGEDVLRQESNDIRGHYLASVLAEAVSGCTCRGWICRARASLVAEDNCVAAMRVPAASIARSQIGDATPMTR